MKNEDGDDGEQWKLINVDGGGDQWEMMMLCDGVDHWEMMAGSVDL